MESLHDTLRETSVLVVVLETSEVYILVSLSTRSDTQVINIDPTTGSLNYTGKFEHDLFNSEEEALNYITDGSRILCKDTTHARALLGYAALGSFGLLLVATRLTRTIPMLPGGGCVYTVTESKWIKVQLQNPQPQGKGELKNIQDLAKLDIDGKHYFCETRDITRPFPSLMNSQNPDGEFVWNAWLSKPFRDIGLPKHCVILLQGFAECRKIGGFVPGGMVALLARRSRLHPGTRYLARGLNACYSTGNEVECEQLVWFVQKSGESFPFSSYVWRRGTIPIWWGADLKFTAAEAEIYVSAQEPYRGSAFYYQRLSRRYKARRCDLTALREKKIPLVPIICVNLLRNGEGMSETILVEHFKESIKYIKSTRKLPSTWIQLINYDWHAIVKSDGEQETISGLWKHLKAPTISIGFSEGNYYPSKQHLKECTGFVVSNSDFEGGFCLSSLQNGVIRFNCADSLDRTNAASFFGCLQVFVEQCKRLGISLDNDTDLGFSSVNRVGEYKKHGGGSLPPGWEECTDAVTGKTFYIDHNTRTTTWEHPCQGEPWKRFNMPFADFKSSTLLSPVNQLADLFFLAGDIHATLYTGSKAMHSQILNIFKEDGGKYSTFQNVKITMQRRYKNILVDSSRQKQLEMFLGIRLFKHLPSAPIHPLKVLSRHSGFFLKSVPSLKPFESGGSSLLSFRKKDLIWVCPPAADIVELFIYLAEPCHVCQLLLTVSHGADDSSYPSTIDVRTGCSIDELKLVLEGACLPQCPSGTNLLIPLTGRIDPEDIAVTGNSACIHSQENSHLPMLYNFEELEGELNFLTQIVALTFYPSVPGRTPLTLGEIEVLGVSLPWRDIFFQSDFGTKFIEIAGSNENKASTFDQHETFMNPFNDSRPNQNIVSSSCNGDSSKLSHSNRGGNAIDLLTGDPILSHSVSLPEFSSTMEQTMSGSGQLFDLSGDHIPEHHSSADTPTELQDRLNNNQGDTASYINILKFFDSDTVKGLDFRKALKLEIARLRLGISAAERDRALLAISIDPASIDPNRLIDDLHMSKLCNHADFLAILGQTAFEDKVNASFGLDVEDNNEIDFWNIGEIGDACIGPKCEVRREIKTIAVSSSKSSTLLFICAECERKACKFCCSGWGATLLACSSNKDLKIYGGSAGQSGSSHGWQNEEASARVPSALGGVICKSCCDEIILDALHVDYIRFLASFRRRTRAKEAAAKSLSHILGHNVGKRLNFWQDKECSNRQLRKLLNGEESLAEFPYANLLYTVETAVGSQPSLSLLAPLGVGEHYSYWRAPPSSSTVEFSVVLGSLSDVSGVTLVVSSCGYSTSDCPTVQIWASHKIHKDERTCMGKWDVSSLVSSSPYLKGLEKSQKGSDTLRHMKFLFPNPVRCRIIWIALTLPKPGSSSNLKDEFDLLSFDENPFAKTSSHDFPVGTVTNEACIHAKRLLVFGSSVKRESQDVSMQNIEMMKMKSSLRSPQWGRFRVPIESERLTFNDLVLELYLSPTAPGLAGFRLDAFSVIRPRITHSPSFADDVLDSPITGLEDRHIAPAILYIQVSAFQEARNYVNLGEYRLPECKGGTPIYFDFPHLIHAYRINFRLFGDVAAFRDDIPDLDDPAQKGIPLASGLSLSNRIKLYYYADPYELGKLASLSAV